MKFLYIHRTRGTGVEKVHIDGVVNALGRLGVTADFISPESGETAQEQITVKNVRPGNNFQKRISLINC